MKNKTKLFAPTILCLRLLLLLVALFWFAPLTNAQDSKPSQKLIIKPIPDGYTIIDGDIVVPTAFVKAILKRQKQAPLVPKANFGGILWTNGIIPFEFQITDALPSDCPNATPSGRVSELNQDAVKDAMEVLEAVANLDFQQCAGSACGTGNRVLVRDTTNDIIRDSNDNCVSGTGNNSQLGMVGGQQIINFGSWGTPSTKFIIVHELLHTLGFHHEHQRAGRDIYITVNCENVRGGCDGTLFEVQFELANDATSYGYYDFDSVMHYGQCTFTSGMNCPTDEIRTITVPAPNQAWQTLIGQRTHLSALDQATVSFLYRFPDWRFLDCTYSGGNGASNGTFGRPYTTLGAALANTPAGGTIWVLNNCSLPVGTYSNQVTIKTAPGVTATFGG